MDKQELKAEQSGRLHRLGNVSCPSGILLLLDGGCAWMWSHDQQPIIPDLPNIVGASVDALDLAITGPDAFVAGQAFGNSYNPLFVYDKLSTRVDDLQLNFAALLREAGLNAALEVLPERVPHRRRVDYLLNSAASGGLVEFHGLSAAVIPDVPRDKLLPIVGERMPPGPDEERWRRIWIDLRDGDVASTRVLGNVWVDEARMMAVDVETLAEWDDRNSQDGKADLVFWGRDAEAVASEFEVGPVDTSAGAVIFGWLDRPIDEAVHQARILYALHSSERKFAVDFRPHTHQWQVMSKVRKSPSESAVLELANTQTTMFMTTWGDGDFPVEADYSANGQLLRVRIELGCERIVARQRELDARWSGRHD